MISPFRSSKSSNTLLSQPPLAAHHQAPKWVPINRSFISLAKIILRALVARRGFVNAAITLRCIKHQGDRHLVLVNEDQDKQVAALGQSEEFIISTETSLTPASEQLNSADSFTLPVDYHGQRLGYLVALPNYDELLSEDGVSKRSVESLMEELALVADDIVNIIKRYETRHRAWYLYGEQAYWIGGSDALGQLDRRMEAVSKTRKPVLIRGNKGSGKVIAARSLHCYRHSDLVPFAEANCAEWDEGKAAGVLRAMTRYSSGDTVFLRNIDKLSETNFKAFTDFYAAQSEIQRVHFILSLSEKNALLSLPMFQWLAEQTVDIQLPDLHERKEDIRDLALYFMQEFDLGVGFDFSDDAWALLESRQWQQNVHELKEVIYAIALRVEKPIVPASMLKDWISE